MSQRQSWSIAFSRPLASVRSDAKGTDPDGRTRREVTVSGCCVTMWSARRCRCGSPARSLRAGGVTRRVAMPFPRGRPQLLITDMAYCRTHSRESNTRPSGCLNSTAPPPSARKVAWEKLVRCIVPERGLDQLTQERGVEPPIQTIPKAVRSGGLAHPCVSTTILVDVS